MQGKTTKTERGSKAYKPDELAALLGVHRGAIYKGAKEGTIPALRIGKRLIFPRAAIDEWLRTAGRQAVSV